MIRPPAPNAPRFDLAYGFALLFVGFTIFQAFMGDNPFDPFVLALNVGLSAFFLIVIRLRYTIVAPLLFSAVAALPIAVLGFGLSFFLGETSFFTWWLLAFGAVLSFVWPGWGSFRRTKKNPLIARMPVWVFSAGASIMLVLSGMVAAGTGVASDEAPAEFSTPSEGTPPPPDTMFGAGSGEEATLKLYFAWKNNSREQALQVAHETAVNDLLSQPFPPGALVLGCGTVSGGFARCVIKAGDGLILAGPEIHSNGRSYIRFIERVPLDHPITYNTFATPGQPVTPVPSP